MPNGLRSRNGNAARLGRWLVLCLVLFAGGVAASAQTPSAPPPQTLTSALLSATPSKETATFSYANRPIVLLRASVLGRSPAERAAGAKRALDDLVAAGITGPVAVQPLESAALVSVGSRVVMGLTAADVDSLSGESIEGVSAQIVARLQIALEETAEARRVRTLLRAAAIALLGLVVGVMALWVISRIHRAVSGKFVAAAEKTVARSKIADLEVLHGMHIADLERRMVAAAMVVLDLVVVYAMLTFILRQFPYTRPWGESLRTFLVTTIANLGLGMLNTLPDLFTVALIVLITRFAIRLLGLWFHAVETGRVTARWIYPETAQPTRRLATTLLWLFGAVMAYPYLPGSQTEAFKGVSVFLGLMVTLGSSGLVNQIMSGFTITYSRALRLGDFVRIGDVEGTVTHLGVLSTKLRTLRNEDVTVPNAVVVSQTTVDFSRYGDTAGVFTPTTVTIGYDAPWRQVHAMLLEAAKRTAGIRREPAPLVLQAGLEDFYVKYMLLVCLERQDSRPIVLAAMHANIQDVFNEYGVQIMSPNYVLDPAAPKVVPKKDWFAAPAAAERPPGQP
jgi:small-conductance mechanosensitive channel